MSHLRFFIFFYLIIILLCYNVNSAEISLRCLIFLKEHNTTAQSVSVVEISTDQSVDKLKREIKKKWPSLEKYNPDQIILRKVSERLTAKKLITLFYNDKIEKGTEMIPLNPIFTYFSDSSYMDCENCVDITVYMRDQNTQQL
jgi:arginine utilization protein RocB